MEAPRNGYSVGESSSTNQNKLNGPSNKMVIDRELEALVEDLLDSQLASLATLPCSFSNNTDDLMSMPLEELEMQAELARIEFIERLLRWIMPSVLDLLKSKF
ncbi:hypothetical protein BLNAU_4218 [Blattamonas nauphoetae]|uniref:Uncharacterized protein n=1 Tax=Blattamonas nauphoetae TaxID=2049346 RepID=A0ABQ9YAL7_9EUKA|nr:hypothetical protein BLNAU_4218 [Blattamonas nauphoetae]